MCELHLSEELASMKMNSPTYTSSVYCSPMINGCLLTPLWPLAPQCYNQNIFMKSDQVEQKQNSKVWARFSNLAKNSKVWARSSNLDKSGPSFTILGQI